MIKGFGLMIIIMIIGFVVAGLWSSVPAIGNTVHVILDPTFGALLNWNIYIGFFIIALIITALSTIVQKYFTDQETLRQMKEEQKKLREEQKLHSKNQEKVMELTQKQMELSMKLMELTTKPIIFTAVPFILLFRWFVTYLQPIWGNWWILYYLILSLILTSVLRKIFKVH